MVMSEKVSWAQGVVASAQRAILVGHVVLEADDMRPAVVAAGGQDVHLVIGLGALLGGVERAVGAEIDALRVAVAIGEDVAAHAADLRIVARGWSRRD